MESTHLQLRRMRKAFAAMRTKCGGEGSGRPGPCPSGVSDKVSNDTPPEVRIQIKDDAKAKIAVDLEEVTLFNPKLAKETISEAHEVIDSMPFQCVHRAMKNIKKFDTASNSEMMREILKHKTKDPNIPQGVEGCYDPSSGGLYFDGGNRRKSVFAHEMAHAVDGPKFELSRSEEWSKAWYSEIVADGNPLSKYATESLAEGFAEFGRLVFSGERPADIQAKFPKCYAFWKSKGLVR